ncbi:unnamed protein product [Protopolystoma xenopodis]|uniref:Uncharacterized protein n=1 Tax=Protopolystoma xenopodis TaxID=117903 RepID=A0A3S5B3Z0_9PLAT|nr:unnamed protein product [Protopolystoma xenopodis]
MELTDDRRLRGDTSFPDVGRLSANSEVGGKRSEEEKTVGHTEETRKRLEEEEEEEEEFESDAEAERLLRTLLARPDAAPREHPFQVRAVVGAPGVVEDKLTGAQFAVKFPWRPASGLVLSPRLQTTCPWSLVECKSGEFSVSFAVRLHARNNSSSKLGRQEVNLFSLLLLLPDQPGLGSRPLLLRVSVLPTVGQLRLAFLEPRALDSPKTGLNITTSDDADFALLAQVSRPDRLTGRTGDVFSVWTNLGFTVNFRKTDSKSAPILTYVNNKQLSVNVELDGMPVDSVSLDSTPAPESAQVKVPLAGLDSTLGQLKPSLLGQPLIFFGSVTDVTSQFLHRPFEANWESNSQVWDSSTAEVDVELREWQLTHPDTVRPRRPRRDGAQVTASVSVSKDDFYAERFRRNKWPYGFSPEKMHQMQQAASTIASVNYEQNGGYVRYDFRNRIKTLPNDPEEVTLDFSLPKGITSGLLWFADDVNSKSYLFIKVSVMIEF